MFISFKDAKVKVVSVASTFERGYTDEYLRSLLEAKYVGKHLFNGDCLRLEGIDISSKEVILKVSKTDYYSLLATNLNNKDFLTDYDVIGNPTLSNNCLLNGLLKLLSVLLCCLSQLQVVWITCWMLRQIKVLYTLQLKMRCKKNLVWM